MIFPHVFGLDLFCLCFACCSREATADLARDEPPAVVVVVLHCRAETLNLKLGLAMLRDKAFCVRLIGFGVFVSGSDP